MERQQTIDDGFGNSWHGAVQQSPGQRGDAVGVSEHDRVEDAELAEHGDRRPVQAVFFRDATVNDGHQSPGKTQRKVGRSEKCASSHQFEGLDPLQFVVEV